jgi:hypothetical protein
MHDTTVTTARNPNLIIIVLLIYTYKIFMGIMRRGSNDNMLKGMDNTSSPRHHDGRLMEQIAKEEIDEEFAKNVPNVTNLRKLLERREHMAKMHVFAAEDPQ